MIVTDRSDPSAELLTLRFSLMLLEMCRRKWSWEEMKDGQSLLQEEKRANIDSVNLLRSLCCDYLI